MTAVPPSWPAAGSSPDEVYAAVTAYAESRGLELYPHQDEAVIELLAGSNVVLATPTGSGKSLVALAAHAAALASDRVSFYTAPIKALVSEKFFDLCQVFGAEDVGMLTGDAAVNPDAPIICCTAEILANLTLREGRAADVGLVVMDEFHYYGEPDRGWAWQVPLLELPDTQFLLMSATLGDTTELREDLTARTGRESVLVDQAERPVPLSFTWSLDPVAEKLEELVTTGQAPVYVVHFTQKDAVEHATSLLNAGWVSAAVSKERKAELAERMAGVRFAAGFGKTLGKLLRRGIGVHHAGMLPRYRRLVEQLAQAGLLQGICGTDTLGVGINVPIRTVLFTGLAKFDGNRSRVLRTREFLQIAGRAGRAGYDTSGFVVVQAPEHVIENEKAKAKAAERVAAGKKKSKAQLKKPPEGTVVWTEATFEKLVAGEPEPLVPRMRVDNAMLLNVVSREEDAFPVLRRLLTENHEPRRQQLRLARRALRLAILTREAENYSTRRLIEAAEARGHTMEVIDTSRCYMNIRAIGGEVHYDGRPLPHYDAVIPRIGASITPYGAAIIRQFETIGTFCVNGSEGITASRDKLYAHQLMARHKIGMPNTAFAASPKDTQSLMRLVGTAPLIVKLLESTQGKGVVLAETKKAAESVIDAFRGLKANFLVQDFVKEAAGEDIRCLVVGGKVVASMKRTGAEGDFRSNLHRGGSAKVVRISKEERDTAIRAAKAFKVSDDDIYEALAALDSAERDVDAGCDGERSRPV